MTNMLNMYICTNERNRVICRHHMYGNPAYNNIFLAWNHQYLTQQCESMVCRKERIRVQVECP
jgi:hypothetical protein